MGGGSEAQVDARQVAADWLAKFDSAVSNRDYAAIADLFLPDGFLRDIFVFTWEPRTLQGQSAIRDFLSANFKYQKLRQFEIYEDNYLKTKLDTSIPGFKVVDFTYTFETDNARGRGGVKLMPVGDEEQAWKAVSVFTSVTDWKGWEEGTAPKRWAEGDTDPDVLVGAYDHLTCDSSVY